MMSDSRIKYAIKLATDYLSTCDETDQVILTKLKDGSISVKCINRVNNIVRDLKVRGGSDGC